MVCLGLWPVRLPQPLWRLLRSAASPDLRPFSAGSLIIPMDACNQAAPDEPIPSYCIDGKTPDDGAVKAYGLIYLSAQAGGHGLHDHRPEQDHHRWVDLTLTHAGGVGAAAGVFDRNSRMVENFTTQNSIKYRGAPFIIDVNEAASVEAMLIDDPIISAFTSVAVHVAYDNFNAPVALRMNGAPPNIAVFAPPTSQGGTQGSEGLPLMEVYLRRAGLDYPGAIGTPANPGDLFNVLTVDDIAYGALAGNYQVVWLPHYETNGSQVDNTAMAQFAAFADAGGMIFAECASIGSFELTPTTQFMTQGNIQINRLNTCYPGDRNGWNAHGFNQGLYPASDACYDPVLPIINNSGAGLSFPAPTNPFIQIGDFPFFEASGLVQDFSLTSSHPYKPGVQHLLVSHDNSWSNNGIDIVAMRNKDNDPNKGQIVYFGGHLYGDADAPVTPGIRIVLNTLLFANPTLYNRYLARSGATLATVGGKIMLFQGTYQENNNVLPSYNTAADTAWPFPQVLGHYRAYDITALTSGTQALSDSTAELWDAAALIPDPPQRTLYTSAGSGSTASLVPLTSTGILGMGNPNPFGLPTGFTTADTLGLLSQIQNANLGGIDHSTSAVIGHQPLIPGGSSRQTVAYAGARDGMLHAFSVDGMVPGTELWGYLPGEQLSSVRFNGVALDASPMVGDIFEAVGGVRKWRTLLVISQGRGGTSVVWTGRVEPGLPEPAVAARDHEQRGFAWQLRRRRHDGAARPAEPVPVGGHPDERPANGTLGDRSDGAVGPGRVAAVAVEPQLYADVARDAGGGAERLAGGGGPGPEEGQPVQRPGLRRGHRGAHLGAGRADRGQRERDQPTRGRGPDVGAQCAADRDVADALCRQRHGPHDPAGGHGGGRLGIAARHLRALRLRPGPVGAGDGHGERGGAATLLYPVRVRSKGIRAADGQRERRLPAGVVGHPGWGDRRDAE